MSIVAREPESNYEPPPEGLGQAVCVDVEDLGFQENHFGGKDQHKVRIHWMLEELNAEGRPYFISQMYTNSLHEKAKLRQHLQSWRGRSFTSEELKGFDLENLIGVNCQIQVVHRITNEGRTFANVSAIVPLGKGMAKLPVPKEYIRRKDRQQQPPGNGAGDVFDDECPF